jgi:hypothetical protein
MFSLPLAPAKFEFAQQEGSMNIDDRVTCLSNSRGADNKRVVLKRNFGCVLAALAVAFPSGFASAQVLPNDAKQTCVFEAGEFGGWFATGAVALNGAVKPADSLGFNLHFHVPPNHPDCNFYKWSEQMFLHVTSPADKTGRVFESPEFYTLSASGPDHRRSLVQNRGFLVRDPKPVEQGGQPNGRGILMATANPSLVYYASHINDVYAYFLTATQNDDPKPQRFPIEESELNRIEVFAKSKGAKLANSHALIVQLKSAWVETTGLDVSKYITISAMIPTYRSNQDNTRWERTDDNLRPAQLALVGMHIVGSVNGHEEMVWATFEHIDNAPMASYSYNNKSDQTIAVGPEPKGTWLFSARNCTDPSRNQERMKMSNASYIDALPGKTIGPIDTCRENAWGGHPGDPRLVEKNTHIIAINSSIMGMLKSGDVRRNYLLIGATWGPGLGSRRLANTTLETFEQDKNCTDCHLGDLPSGNLSHMYLRLKPLFP